MASMWTFGSVSPVSSVVASFKMLSDHDFTRRMLQTILTIARALGPDGIEQRLNELLRRLAGLEEGR